MSPQSLPTFRAAHLLPYLAILSENGAQFDSALRKFQLPTTFGDDPDALLPLAPTVRFLSHMQKSQGINDLETLASERVNFNLLSHANKQAILASPTLGAALSTFIRQLWRESSVVEGRIVIRGSEIKLCKSHHISLDDEELRLMKFHFMLLFISVIRVFVGPCWSPNVLALRCRAPLRPIVGHRFPGMRFLFGQAESSISLPSEMLTLQKGYNHNSPTECSARVERMGSSDPMPDDLAVALKRVLKGYLADGYPSVDLAAEIVGTSVRTLQRCLAQSGLTYSKLVEIARFETASEMLQDSDAKIIDVAYAVGYEDPSHFSRAFRRMAGTCPRGFRAIRAA